jgi:hypothetical protein
VLNITSGKCTVPLSRMRFDGPSLASSDDNSDYDFSEAADCGSVDEIAGHVGIEQEDRPIDKLYGLSDSVTRFLEVRY